MLAHIKLALLLSVLSSSLILQARLVPTADAGDYVQEYGMPLAIIQFIAALLAIAAGVWEFHVGCRDLMRMRAFLVAPKYVLCFFILSPRLPPASKAPFRYHDRGHGHCVHHLYNLARQGRYLTKSESWDRNKKSFMLTLLFAVWW